MISEVEHLLIYLLAICMFSLEKFLFKSFAFFFFLLFWLWSYRSSLHILGMSPLDIWFANIFSLSIPLIISFVVHKHFSFSLIQSHLSIFTFVVNEFCAVTKKSLLRQPWYCKVISLQLNELFKNFFCIFLIEV